MNLSKPFQLQLALALLGLSLLGPAYLFKQGIDGGSLLPGIAGLIGAFLAYSFLAKYVPDHIHLPTRYHYLGALLVRLPVLALPIFIDDALYRALWDGWIQHNGFDPYSYFPSSSSLELVQTGRLYDLLEHTTAYSSYSPIYQIPYRFMGYIYDYFGLATSILVFKGVAIALDLLIIQALFKWFDEFTERFHTGALLAFVLNPLWILFYTGQGLILQLAILLFLWIAITWKRNYGELSAILWGAFMMATPLGIVLWPYVIRRLGWKGALLPLITVIAWWIPFFSLNSLQHYWFGTVYHWLQPESYTTFGYFLVRLMSEEADVLMAGLYWLPVSYGILLAYTAWDAWKLEDIELGGNSLDWLKHAVFPAQIGRASCRERV